MWDADDAAFGMGSGWCGLGSPLALLAVGVVCVTVSGGLIVCRLASRPVVRAVAAGMDFFEPASRNWVPALPLGWVSMAVPYAPVLFACGVAASVSDGDGADVIPARAATSL